MAVPDLIKIVHFHVESAPQLPPAPYVDVLAWILSAPAGLPTGEIADLWVVHRYLADFEKVIAELSRSGWIERIRGDCWRATAKAQATCLISVDERPARRRTERPNAWIARYYDWLQQPAQDLLQ